MVSRSPTQLTLFARPEQRGGAAGVGLVNELNILNIFRISCLHRPLRVSAFRLEHGSEPKFQGWLPLSASHPPGNIASQACKKHTARREAVECFQRTVCGQVAPLGNVKRRAR